MTQNLLMLCLIFKCLCAFYVFINLLFIMLIVSFYLIIVHKGLPQGDNMVFFIKTC